MTARAEPEPLIIRPPTEAGSVLIRVTRGCNWNRCRFCGIYARLGQPDFEVRPLDEVKADIEVARELYGADARTAFLGDADPIIADPDDLVEILRHLRRAFPRLERVTCYARSSTVWIRRERLCDLARAGLSRVHIGLETGDDGLLRYHRKGVSAHCTVDAGRAVRQAGIDVSHYVLLGLGGADRWKPHVAGTVQVLNAVEPEFVRFRRLWIFGEEDGPPCPLYRDVQAGTFTPQTPEGTVVEMREIIAGLAFPTEIEAIHNNLFVRFAGRLPGDRGPMLRRIDAFLSQPEAIRARTYARPSVI